MKLIDVQITCQTQVLLMITPYSTSILQALTSKVPNGSQIRL